jgi:hypothetical protein
MSTTEEGILEKRDLNAADIEKNFPSGSDAESEHQRIEGEIENVWWLRLVSWGVEIRGVLPVPVRERTDARFVNIFSLWFTMSVTILP